MTANRCAMRSIKHRFGQPEVTICVKQGMAKCGRPSFRAPASQLRTLPHHVASACPCFPTASSPCESRPRSLRHLVVPHSAAPLLSRSSRQPPAARVHHPHPAAHPACRHGAASTVTHCVMLTFNRIDAAPSSLPAQRAAYVIPALARSFCHQRLHGSIQGGIACSSPAARWHQHS